jgi:hypothetical protein
VKGFGGILQRYSEEFSEPNQALAVKKPAQRATKKVANII